MQIIEKEEVNTGRQSFMDIAKVFAILGMICSHISLVSQHSTDVAFPLYIFMRLTGEVFAAPVFMFSMGVGLAYSRRSTPEYISKRGVELTIKGWLLNIVRGTIPFLLLYYVFKKTELSNQILYSLTCIDILQFAGLAFLVFALFKKMNFSAKTILGIAIVMALIATFIGEISVNTLWLKVPVGYFMAVVSDKTFGTAFPLLHWFIFVAGGYYFGGLLKRCSNVNKLLLRITPVAFVIFISYLIFAITNKFGMYGGKGEAAYYHMHFLDMIYTFTAVFTMFGFCQFISKFMNEKVLNICGDIGKNLNEIYIQQWIYIAWSMSILKYLCNISFRLRDIFIGTIIVFVVSAVLAHWYRTKRVKTSTVK